MTRNSNLNVSFFEMLHLMRRFKEHNVDKQMRHTFYAVYRVAWRSGKEYGWHECNDAEYFDLLVRP